MRAGLVVEHGTLNATVRSVEDPDWPGGVRVTFDQMLAPGVAHDSGIQVGDALVEFQGEPITSVNQFSRLIAVLPKGRRVSLKSKRYDDGKWIEQSYRLVLEGIPLITKEKLKLKKPARGYLDQEIDRTFRAARRALPPITAERRTGTLTVRGRDPKPLAQTFDSGRVTLKIGDRLRTATSDGGTDGDKPLDPDYRKDMLERVAAWNDMLAEGARTKFAEVKFTGGALVHGVTVDRIEVKTADGAERVYFIHLDTGRLLRLDLYSHTWVRWLSLFFSDWRTAGGLQRPYKVTIWDRQKESLLQTITYTAVARTG
jgi:hypothetical protein